MMHSQCLPTKRVNYPFELTRHAADPVVAWHDAFSTRGSELTDTGPYSKFAAVCASSATTTSGALAAAHNDPDLELGSIVKSQGWAGGADGAAAAQPGEPGGEHLEASQLLLLQTDRQILQEQVRSLREQLKEAEPSLLHQGPCSGRALQRGQEWHTPGATPGRGHGQASLLPLRQAR